MTKKFWLAFVAVFVTAEVLNMVVYNYILGTAFSSLSVWRADMNSHFSSPSYSRRGTKEKASPKESGTDCT
jgi:hypothetical protein